MSQAVDTPSDWGVPEETPIAPPLQFPDEWTLSSSWQRAQTEADYGGPVSDHERVVHLENGDPHRVVFTLNGATLRAHCSCDGFRYRDWCAHTATCWWRWINAEIAVTHQQTGREYLTPPKWLRVGHDRADRKQLDGLTAAELDAYLSCDLAHVGVRKYARSTGRSPGTVGNLLNRARSKVRDGSGVA